MPADTLGVPMLDGGEDPAPAVLHREHPNAIGAPHEVRGMSDDLTVMGISATAAAAMGREQIVLAHQAEHPRAVQFTLEYLSIFNILPYRSGQPSGALL